MEAETIDSAETQRELQKAQHLLSPDVKCDAPPLKEISSPSCAQHNPERLSGNIQLIMSQCKKNSLILFMRFMATLKHEKQCSSFTLNLKYAENLHVVWWKSFETHCTIINCFQSSWDSDQLGFLCSHVKAHCIHLMLIN